MPLAASDPQDRAEQLIILTNRITDLIKRETELLEKRRPSALADTADERNKLSSLYSHEIALIRADNSLLAGIGPALKQGLTTATEQFQDALAAHEKVVTRMRTVSEKIIRAVADDVAAKKAPKAGYGDNAMLNAPTSHGSGPIALNQVI